MNKAITANKLTKKFGNFIATNAITFDVDKGEVFGFLGANGAGKTTAIKMLTGLSRPTSGEATVAGLDIYRHAEQIKQQIGYMSQKFSLYEDMTVSENIEFYGGIYGLKRSEIRERGGKSLDQLSMTNVRNHKVNSLPLGWKQKLAFAVATLHKPGIVFLDEPTGGVDPITRRQFWEMIYQAAEEGITVFVTTHYMDEAEYCNRISIMVEGLMVACDSPAALKSLHNASSIEEVFIKIARNKE
ncbi:MAG TPA: ABC transporter [Flavobacteriales bacterium]|nr:ABC transporter [Flavobacteriales bacterium]